MPNCRNPLRVALDRTVKDQVCEQTPEYFIGYFHTPAGSESVIYLELPEPIDDERAQEMRAAFSRNVAVIYDGLLLEESTVQASICRSHCRAAPWKSGPLA